MEGMFSRVAVAASLALIIGLGVVPGPVVSPLMTASARAAEPGFEDANTSKVAGIELSGTAQRAVSKEVVDKMLLAVHQVGEQRFDQQVTQEEMLGWDLAEGKNKPFGEIRSEVIAALKRSGYTYSAVEGEFNLAGNGGKDLPVQFFCATRSSGAPILGYWLPTPQAVVLCWAKMKADPGVQGGGRQETPAGLIGEWRKTMITATTYTDSYTGAYAGSGAQGAQIYEFLPGGRYKFSNYIKTRVYASWTEAYTWEDGTFSINGDRIVLRPTGGKFKVAGAAASQNYTRPYTAQEIKDRKKSFSWKLENGKLLLGDTPSNRTEFKKVD